MTRVRVSRQPRSSGAVSPTQRLWEQYADSHRGVCICFDRTTLIRVVKDAVRKIDEVTYGEVTYADGEIAPEAVRIPLKQLLERPIEETFDRYVRAHLHDLFFTKLRDWESECEFRFVIDLPYGAIARRKGYLPPEPEPPPPELVPA